MSSFQRLTFTRGEKIPKHDGTEEADIASVVEADALFSEPAHDAMMKGFDERSLEMTHLANGKGKLAEAQEGRAHQSNNSLKPKEKKQET
jgi:hypothetical protein